MNTKQVTVTIIATIVATVIVTMIFCYHVLLSPRDWEIKVLTTKLKASEKLRGMQQAEMQVLYEESDQTNNVSENQK